jgi:phosphoribosyl 1,2-cyclic phosphodiesterase
MRICTLASGSSGNCTYVESESAKILIDAGISAKRVRAALAKLDVTLNQIDALLITHEHSDHVNEAGIVSIASGCPIYSTERTYAAFWNLLSGHEKICHFQIGHDFVIKDLQIHPFRVFHDAVDPCGFIIRGRGLFAEHAKQVAIATDLGTFTPQLTMLLQKCEVLVLESNHDLEMLIKGDYPWHLKQRIRSEVGHLSNRACAEAIASLASFGYLKRVILVHLSESNNHPEKAVATIEECLKDSPSKIELIVAPREEISKIIKL